MKRSVLFWNERMRGIEKVWRKVQRKRERFRCVSVSKKLLDGVSSYECRTKGVTFFLSFAMYNVLSHVSDIWRISFCSLIGTFFLYICDWVNGSVDNIRMKCSAFKEKDGWIYFDRKTSDGIYRPVILSIHLIQSRAFGSRLILNEIICLLGFNFTVYCTFIANVLDSEHFSPK